MGVVNLTPDSFSDGGEYFSMGNVNPGIAHARRLLDEGADILDIGGESTRPGALEVDAETEWRRLAPVIEAAREWQVPISLDSRKPIIMQRGLQAGVDILNDVSGFRDRDAQRLLAESKAGAVVMHMSGDPHTMQLAPHYGDPVVEVGRYLDGQVQHLLSRGVARERLLIDPGIGFGKTTAHNVALLQAIGELSTIAGVLVGVSRKSMIGELTAQADPAKRLAGSVAAALFAASLGACVLRVHDVRATVDACRVWAALSRREPA
ncbi:MAG: dihydropteroate synthase [Burkholderiaceae bacterium]